jgi:plastocyanin domain-containing protein
MMRFNKNIEWAIIVMAIITAVAIALSGKPVWWLIK